jgi:hypothetical protein
MPHYRRALDEEEAYGTCVPQSTKSGSALPPPCALPLIGEEA